MSIGIGLIIPDGVILVADGRRRYPQSDNSHFIDDADKVNPLGDHIFTIPIGFVQVTELATPILKSSIKSISSPESIKDAVYTSLKIAWNQILMMLASDVDINHPTMRAALIVGGISQKEPFIAACLHGTGVDQKPLLIKDSFNFIVIGGEEHESNFHFKKQLETIMKEEAWNFSEGPLNRYIERILKAANNTIRHIGNLDNSIGGIVNYAIIRKDFPVIKESYISDKQGEI